MRRLGRTASIIRGRSALRRWKIPERISYSTTSGQEGDDAHTHRVIVEFREKGTKTEVSMRMIFPSAAERDQVVNVYGAVQGLNDTMDRLGEYL